MTLRELQPRSYSSPLDNEINASNGITEWDSRSGTYDYGGGTKDLHILTGESSVSISSKFNAKKETGNHTGLSEFCCTYPYVGDYNHIQRHSSILGR